MSYKNKKIRAILTGTSDFGIPSFQALLKDQRFEITGVITQPDKPTDRKQIITPPPIKVEAEKNGITVYQPEKINDIKSKIENLKSEIGVVISYGQIIPEEILEIPECGFINVHGSLLPKYRGAACAQAAILNGDKQTGITIIKIDKGLDTGPILWQDKLPIAPDDTAETLLEKLSRLAAEILPSVIEKYIAGEIKPIPQDDAQASYVKQLKKQDGLIDWTKPAKEIERFVRAMQPWPGAFTNIKNKKTGALMSLKIAETAPNLLAINQYKAGEFFLINNGLAAQCGRNALIIKKLQLEGKKEMNSLEFLKGSSWIL